MRHGSIKAAMSAALVFVLVLCFSACGCGHEYSSPADCTEPARCLDCGKSDGLPAGHEWLDADCTSPETCARCGDTKGEARAHNWRDASSDAPKTCKRCGATEGEPLAPESAVFEQVFEDVCAQISMELANAEFEYDEAVCILYVSIPAEKGTAKSIALDPDKVTGYWKEISEKICSVSREASESFIEAGFMVDCCVILINDLNKDNFLLAAYNGEISFSVLED